METEPLLQLDLSSDESLLIEYLDGELTQSDRRTIEERLAKEPDLRETLAKLEESWRCLELLETFSTDKELVETTLETVILDTEQEITQQAKNLRRRFSWKLVLRPFFLFLLFVIGTFFGGKLAPDKNFFLRIASPIIERLDMYLLMYDQDPELLPRLAQHRVFLPPLPEGSKPIDLKEYEASSSAKILDSFTLFPNFWESDRRIARINNLDDALFRQFYRNNEKFNDYSMEKKHRLKEFHERIELSPQRHELVQTLKSYYNWWKSLQSYERSEINQPRLTAERRVELIAAMKKRLETNREVPGTAPLRDDDHDQPTLEELATFLRQLDWYHQELVLNLPPEQTIPYLTRLYRTTKR